MLEAFAEYSGNVRICLLKIIVNLLVDKSYRLYLYSVLSQHMKLFPLRYLISVSYFNEGLHSVHCNIGVVLELIIPAMKQAN